MQRKKLLILSVLVMSILFSGCSYEAIINDAVNQFVEQITIPLPTVVTEPPEPFIGFAETDVEDLDELCQLKQEDLQNYTSRYSAYNSYHYFEYLNDSEKLLYHAYEYALDEALPCFWVDDRLLENVERVPVDVLEFLALDSAMVGQNYSHSHADATVTHHNGRVDTYTVIYVDDFVLEKQQRKEEAIAKAQQILSGAPENGTPRELAEYFYDYLGNSVTYVDKIESEEYLYTAFCQGQSNCDGYTNAFALLCGMADIPCIEINSDTPEGETGHTWNAAYLEERWVHVDCTAAVDDVTSECENRRKVRPNFGLSDALLMDRIDYAEQVPDCPEGLTTVLHIPSGQVEDLNDKIKAEFTANDNRFAVILVDEGDLEDQITDELINKLDCGLYYIYYETAEGKMAYYLFNDD